VTGTRLEDRSFDVLTDARQVTARLLDSDVLAVHECDVLRDLAARIDQSVARKVELGHVGHELAGPRERWPEWDFRREGSEWVANAQDTLARLRSPFLTTLEDKVRDVEDLLVRLGNGKKMPLDERRRWAEINRARGRAEQ
jgi:hypothetical protein